MGNTISDRSACSVCCRLYEHRTDDISFPLEQLEETVQGGCPTCYIILEGINRVISTTGAEGPFVRLSIQGVRGGEPTATVTCWEAEDRRPRRADNICVVFSCFKDGKTPVPWDKLQATIPLEDELSPPSVESRLDAATDWLASCLKECDSSHSTCIERKTGKQVALPGRLLDLETGLVNPTVKLVKPVDDFTAPYMTLSHRWGNLHPCITTKSNLSQRFRQIKMAELPNTYQQAVKIARKFGVRFLWIDSLCIVQDDAMDWEVEASKMASIYAGSYLTVAAVSSMNCNGGCIAEYPLSTYHRIDAKKKNHGSVYVRQEPWDVRIENAHSDVTGGNVPMGIPLLSRAWVYQERLLSPRVAHFHKSEIFWECSSSLECKCGEELRRPNTSEDDTTPIRPSLDQIPVENLLGTWEDIISTYSMLLITYPKDKLPAMAGIASLFSQHVKGSEYLAGIWKALLPDSLFWHTSPVQPWIPEITRKEYQAPSWSWAAANTPVMITPGTLHEDCTILDIWCRFSPKNPFGAVTEGCLKVTGLYLEQPIFESRGGRPASDFMLRFPELDILIRFHPDDIYAYLDFPIYEELVMPWTVVFVAKSTGTTYAGPGAPLMLVLKKSENVEGSYHRIGLGTCNDASSSEKGKWRRDEPLKVFNVI